MINILLRKERVMEICKRFIKKILSALILPFIYYKFKKDSKELPLERGHYRTYIQLHTSYWMTFLKFPDLIYGDDYNQKIQWLKLFDNDALMIQCVDKVLVRDYINDVLGTGYLPDLYQSQSAFDLLDLNILPKSFVLKTNHDSGTVFLVKDKEMLDISKYRYKIESSLKNKYGTYGGEWSYKYVKPLVFIEQYLGGPNDPPPADYKFHCVNGEVKWLQYIYDRADDVKEVIVDPSGKVMDVHFDTKMKHEIFFHVPKEFSNMISIAEKISNNFKYVRVDLYLIEGMVIVGELTFFPLAGCYRGKGQVKLGHYLNFNRSDFKKPICG